MTTINQPVAWAAFAENGNIRIWTSAQKDIRKLAETVGFELVPLYTSPVVAAPARVPDGLADVMAAVFRELEHREGSRGNAPGHSHDVPGVWDSDNGPISGQPCAWCALWNKAKAMLSAAPAAPADAVAKDAERYRWLRDSVGEHWHAAIDDLIGVESPDDVDAAIDAAMAAQKCGAA